MVDITWVSEKEPDDNNNKYYSTRGKLTITGVLYSLMHNFRHIKI